MFESTFAWFFFFCVYIIWNFATINRKIHFNYLFAWYQNHLQKLFYQIGFIVIITVELPPPWYQNYICISVNTVKILEEMTLLTIIRQFDRNIEIYRSTYFDQETEMNIVPIILAWSYAFQSNHQNSVNKKRLFRNYI